MYFIIFMKSVKIVTLKIMTFIFLKYMIIYISKFTFTYETALFYFKIILLFLLFYI